MAKPDVQPVPDVQPDVDAPDVDAAHAALAARWRAAHDASCTCAAWREPSEVDAADAEPAPLEAGGAPW